MTRPRVTTRNDDGMRRSLGISTGLHIAAILFLYFGLPSLMKPLATPSVPVPFEIVELAEITNTRVKEQEEIPQPPQPQPKPEPKAAPAPPQPPQPEQAKPQPQEQKPEQVEALTPAPVPSQKPKPPAPAKPQQDNLASVLKNVAKLKPAEEVKTPDTQSPTKSKAEAQPKSMAPSLSSRLTISEEDALRRQIEIHWNVPIGARDVQSLVVAVHIDVNQDRTVQNVTVVDKARMATDPYFRAMAESVVRAIYQSSPLELPEGKYDQWKGIDSNFSAKDML